MKIIYFLALLTLFINHIGSDITIRETIILTAPAQQHLREVITQDEGARSYFMNIQQEAQSLLEDHPSPLEIIHYEGLLNNNPKRIATQKSLEDMDKVAVWLSAYYGSGDEVYERKAKKYILVWMDEYQPTGNPINENKLEPLIHSYQVMKNIFSQEEQKKVNDWLGKIAEAEMKNPHIPQNNWKAKQIKLVGTIGLVVGKPSYVQYAITEYKAYVDKALCGDGTSRDLHQRDALSYHVSGLDPLIAFAITLHQSRENPDEDLFRYQNADGGSVKKSVDFVLPYAMGDKQYAQWVNTKVKLDKERAEAGLKEYQPGRLFDPTKALDTYELAYFFDKKYKDILQVLTEDKFETYPSWLALLIDIARAQ